MGELFKAVAHAIREKEPVAVVTAPPNKTSVSAC